MPFTRRFTTYPSDAVLLAIEAINVVDLVPPGSIQGSGSGVVALIGEFLKGPINTPTEVTSAQELKDTFGLWSPYSNPGGARPAPGNPGALPLDGNGFLALRNRKFGRLVITRVKDDVGTVTMTITTDVLGGGFYPPFAGTLPAGIRCQNNGATNMVALDEDTTFNANVAPVAGASWTGAGPYTCTLAGIKVRRLLGAASPFVPDPAPAFAVPAPETTGCFPGYTIKCTVGSAITDINEATMSGTYYQAALDALLSDSKPANEVSVVWGARHPATPDGDTWMKAGRQHAIDASAKGKGRLFLQAPPLGTAKATAIGAATVGVGSVGLSDRAVYCYPGAQTFIPELPAAYISSSSNGIINWPADSDMAAVLSNLDPEYNPGMQTAFLGHVLGIETGVTGLTMTDYQNFRAAGIAALRVDPSTGVQFQSGVTSVNPATYPSLRNIARRRMADFMQDSIATALVYFQKGLNTPTNRRAAASMIEEFLEGLLSSNNPAAQRILAYSVDEDSGNTTAKLAQGIFVILVNVQTISSMDAIVIQATMGESVTVTTD